MTKKLMNLILLLLAAIIILPILGSKLFKGIFDIATKNEYKPDKDLLNNDDLDLDLDPKPTKVLTAKEIIDNIRLVDIEDDFDDKKYSVFQHVTNKDYSYLPMYHDQVGDFVSHVHLGLGFVFIEGYVVLEVTSYDNKGFGIAKSDELILLFEDKERLNLVFNHSRSNQGAVAVNRYFLNDMELLKLCTVNLDKWKLTSTRQSLYTVGDNTLFYQDLDIQDKETFQKVLKYMASKMNLKKEQPVIG